MNISYLFALLVLAIPRPTPRTCVSTVLLMDDFDAFYAVYWNGYLLGRGYFLTDASVGAAFLQPENARSMGPLGLCVEQVADRNELVIKNQAGNTMLRKHLSKREVADVLLVRKYGRFWSVTPHSGPLRLE